MGLCGKLSVLEANDLLGLRKRNHTPFCSSEELFFAERNGGGRGKISVVDVASLVFGLEIVFEARKVFQKMFFRWW